MKTKLYLLLITALLSPLTRCKKESIPNLTTSTILNITQTTATSGGDITDAGGTAITARGVCWSVSQDPTITDSYTNDGTGAGSFTSHITGLTTNTTYYVKAYATNSVGTAYGSQISFNTLTLPILTTATISNITPTTASGGGNITNDGGTSILARGVCWSTSQNPTISNSRTTDGLGTGYFTSIVTELTPNTTYYLRAYATNSAGTAFGGEISFMTIMTDGPGSQISDVDGNLYNTAWIGGRLWMTENLKTTKYNDNTVIPNVTDQNSWNDLITPGYCWFNNDATTFKDTYGALYNWFAVNTGKLCPTGWHVPSDAEWTTLEIYLQNNGYNLGGLLDDDNDRGTRNMIAKSLASTTYWTSSNGIGHVGNTDFPSIRNKTGFSALPGGERTQTSFYDIRVNGNWWSSTEAGPLIAWNRYFGYNYVSVDRIDHEKRWGFSIRCLKD